jgi:hypothetical protein
MTPALGRIAELNDLLRTSFLMGRVVITKGVRSLGADFESATVEAVQSFKAFTPDNDPYGERDFGAVTVTDRKVFWKIDYYAPDMIHGSEDLADPQQTMRVLTIILTEEY